MPFDAAAVARVLGGQRTLKRRIQSLPELRELVLEGLPVEALDEVASHVADDPRSVREFMDRIVPRATRHRRKDRLKTRESEKLERVARVVALAESVWEDRQSAREFLTTPQPGLGDAVPLELSDTELGAREVEQLLQELEYGLPV